MTTADFINRRTEYRFAGKNLKLDLSLGLFSSAGVDAGSLLLLKSLAKELELDGVAAPRRILDVGCGTGTLGLALASRLPEARVLLTDRDELALTFSRHNASLNRLENVETSSRLMMENPHEFPYDLIVSNFPAKAGDPVLEDFLRRSLEALAPEGRTALVIVYTLAERCRELIGLIGGNIIHEDTSKMHTVFHFRSNTAKGNRPAVPNSPKIADSEEKTDEYTEKLLTPYIRYSGEFKMKRTRYHAHTVWNIPDFDTLSWRLTLIGELLEREPRSGVLLCSNPGQGHLPLALAVRKGARPNRIILTGRDRLQLLISRSNLKNAVPGLPVETLPLADPSLLAGSIEDDTADFLLTDLNPVPRTDWTAPLREAAAKVVKKGGEWAILGRSADVTALLKYSKGWTPLDDRRSRGWRAVILRRN